MKVAILFSGGKDSTMALYYALKEEEDVKYLLSMKSVNDESYMFHVPNIHITDLLAVALDIPIISAVTQGVKEEVIIDSLHECMTKNKKVTIRSIDKIIIKRLSSKDLKEEGYSAVNEKWKKELEDTIDIANTKWTDEE